MTETVSVKSAPVERNYVILKVQRSRGYSGQTNQQGWISEPFREGQDASRVFMEPDHMDWGDSELYRKRKGVWHAVYHLSLNEMYDVDWGGGDGRVTIVTFRASNGAPGYVKLDDARRTAMLNQTEQGKTVDEARLVTRPPSQ